MRFSLRTLLVALTVVCICLSLVASSIWEAARQRQAVAVMEDELGNLPWIGVSFNHHTEVQDPYYESFFDSFHRKVTGIMIVNVDADRVLMRLPQIHSLRAFRLVDGELTDQGVQVLCRFELTDIEIDQAGSHVTDAGLLTMAKIKTLRTLHLACGGVSEQGIAEFKRRRPDVTVWRSSSDLDMEIHYSQ